VLPFPSSFHTDKRVISHSKENNWDNAKCCRAHRHGWDTGHKWGENLRRKRKRREIIAILINNPVYVIRQRLTYMMRVHTVYIILIFADRGVRKLRNNYALGGAGIAESTRRPGFDLRWGKEIFSSPQRPDRLWDSPSLLSIGVLEDLSPGVKRPGCELDHHLVSKSRMAEPYCPIRLHGVVRN
jgi:hypothetical protein